MTDHWKQILFVILYIWSLNSSQVISESVSSLTTQDLLIILRDQDARISDIDLNFDLEETETRFDGYSPSTHHKRENITYMAKGDLFRTRKKEFDLGNQNSLSFDQEFSADGKTQYFCNRQAYMGSVQFALPQNSGIRHRWAVFYLSCIHRAPRMVGNHGFECNLIGALEEDDSITVSNEFYEGRPAIVLTRPEYSKIYLDPQLNYAVLGTKSIGDRNFEQINSNFIEVVEGVWMPMNSEQYLKDDSTSITRKIKVNKISINNNFTEEKFKIHFPPGVRVYDYNINTYITPSSKELDSVYLEELLDSAEEKGFIDVDHTSLTDKALSQERNIQPSAGPSFVSDGTANYSSHNTTFYLKLLVIIISMGMTIALFTVASLRRSKNKS